MITITPLQPNHIDQAASMFVNNFRQERGAAPALPAHMEDPEQTIELLKSRVRRGAGLAAWEQERLAGYLTWYEVDDFRDTRRKAAYVPEWGHAASGEVMRVYQALYRSAGEQWQASGCQVHAITLLAHDEAAREAWFWNGFGLAVVDAVRPMQVIQPPEKTGSIPAGSGLIVRQALLADAQDLAELEAEHCRHYSAAPIHMAPRQVESPEEISAFLSEPPNSMWLALDGDRPAGFLRFSGASEGAAAVVASDQGAAIIGAYVRPEYRGRRAALALLNAAIQHYQGQGYTCCSVDFESFNPEAAVFWMRYFTPVCFSLFRTPENI